MTCKPPSNTRMTQAQYQPPETSGFLLNLEGSLSGLGAGAGLSGLSSGDNPILPKVNPSDPMTLPKRQRVDADHPRYLTETVDRYGGQYLSNLTGTTASKEILYSISHAKTKVCSDEPVQPKLPYKVNSYVQRTQNLQKPRQSTKYLYLEGGPFSVWKRTDKQSISSGYSGFRTDIAPLKEGVISNASWKVLDKDIANGWHPSLNSVTPNYGAKAYDKFKPLKPTANFGYMLSQLERLPVLWGSAFIKAQTFRALGGEYLNHQFNWKPFLRDLANLITTTQQFQQLLAEIKRDNGQLLHNRGTVYKSRTSETRQDGGFPGLLPPSPYVTGINSFSDRNSTSTTETLDISIRFAGAWSFFYPDVNSPKFEQHIIRRLYGLNMTPKLIFDIIPFSWLLDWFADIGSIFSNLSDDDQSNLVLKYGYVMGTYTKRTVTTATVYLQPIRPFPGWDADPFGVTVTYESTETLKDRYVCEPFGWGKHFATLNGSQLAVLTALGISKLPV